ncbi:MAG TPA: hypothetical protein VLR29_01450, partial [Flavobacterium sp.]|nr:hypothetical protein [Flavobacterium sp.]
MIKVEKYGVILSATEKEFENKGVLNPGVYQEGETVHLLYRAIGEGSFSSIGYAKTKGALKIVDRQGHPLIVPKEKYESHGIQDARIVKIEDIYYITYGAYDGINSMGVLATTKDLVHFEKHGVITPRFNYEEYKRCITNEKNAGLNPKYLYYYNLFSEIGIISDENRLLSIKDVTLFPRKINGKFAMLIGIWPGIQIVYFDDFADLTKEFWTNYLENLIDYVVLDPKSIFEVNHMGVGGPPLETKEGWILIYYGVQETTTGKNYSAKCALLDIDHPEIEIARLDYPILA